IICYRLCSLWPSSLPPASLNPRICWDVFLASFETQLRLAFGLGLSCPVRRTWKSDLSDTMKCRAARRSSRSKIFSRASGAGTDSFGRRGKTRAWRGCASSVPAKQASTIRGRVTGWASICIPRGAKN
ncbi:hypothetical protein MPH_08260, partial [Macrophomina phaseolina MS6]